MSPLILAALSLLTAHYGDSFGASLYSLGDMNHDGLNEFIVTDPSFSTDEPSHALPCGSLWVIDGRTGKVLYQIQGERPGDAIGYQYNVDVGGDCDGDGARDFIVHSSARRFVSDTATWTLVSGATGKRIRSGTAHSSDGRIGFGLAARTQDNLGACVVIATSSITGPQIDIDFLSTVTGESIEHRNVPGRGFVSLATTPWSTNPTANSSWEILLMQSGCRSPPYTNPAIGEDWDRTRLHALTPKRNDELLYTRDQPLHAYVDLDILSGFDLDGDGVLDHVMLIPSDEHPHEFVAAISGASGRKLWSVADSGGFPRDIDHSLCWIRDADGDKIEDVVVASPNRGLVDHPLRVLSGKTGKLIRIVPHVHDDEYEMHFGSAICELGDLDADGVTDLVVGDMGIGANSNYPCFVRIVSGSSGKTLMTLARDGSGSRIESR